MEVMAEGVGIELKSFSPPQSNKFKSFATVAGIAVSPLAYRRFSIMPARRFPPPWSVEEQERALS
jgi:hypothetical protein